ncbi:dihydropteroate synthase [Endozoicomonas sp. Mp262]|uniref:dihydropteroate synthase n=1 Tax=Endozoicomonas sp. Mp262 TaxID=2919499 RepID=UPI0021D91D1D
MSKGFELNCGGKLLDLSRPRVMGVLNVTPDSFYAGSRCSSLDHTLQRAEDMINSGADILDVGGESTSKMVQRFGYVGDNNRYVGGQLAEQDQADTASCQQELERVIPVVEALAKRFDCVVSVDTSSALAIKEAALAGAGMINDIRALQRPGALDAAAATELPVILMHSLIDHPEPGFVPHYNDVMTEVLDYLKERVQCCEQVGIDKQRLIIDPGFGGGLFGKNPGYDLSMLKHFEGFHELDLPVLAGMSRKSFIGATLNKGPDERLAGSLAVALMAVQAGAHILRVHDVAETCDILRMVEAVRMAV